MINRLYYTKSNSFKLTGQYIKEKNIFISPLKTKENLYESEDIPQLNTQSDNNNFNINKLNLKKSPILIKRKDLSNFSNYLDKIANYENKRLNTKK